MSEPLTALDATFLEIEQMGEGATMHIGGVMVFDSPARGAALLMDTERRHGLAAELAAALLPASVSRAYRRPGVAALGR